MAQRIFHPFIVFLQKKKYKSSFPLVKYVSYVQ